MKRIHIKNTRNRLQVSFSIWIYVKVLNPCYEILIFELCTTLEFVQCMLDYVNSCSGYCDIRALIMIMYCIYYTPTLNLHFISIYNDPIPEI